MAFLERLQIANAETQQKRDKWLLRLERVRGKVGDDGIERISTQTLFDYLEVPQRSRRAGASRRLAGLMRELGWTAVRVRDLTRGGYLEQVRGYCRDARHQQQPTSDGTEDRPLRSVVKMNLTVSGDTLTTIRRQPVRERHE